MQYAGIAREGQNVAVRFRDAERARQGANQEIGNAFPDLQLKEADDGGEFKLVATLEPEAQKRIQDGAVQQNITTLRNRVNELGVAEPIIQQQGADRVVVQLPGVQDTARAKDILGRTATLEIRMVDDEHRARSNRRIERPGAVLGSELYTEREGAPLLVKQPGGADRRLHQRRPARLRQPDQRAGRAYQPGRHAARASSSEVTRENVGKRMAILLIEKGKGEVITAPVIREEIGGGRVQISGRMTTREANDVVAAAARRRARRADGNHRGTHRRPDRWARTTSTRASIRYIYGFIAIALFMMSLLPLFGVISAIALAVNLLLLVAMLSMLQATLTLPGMAAIALTLGMAIDANVLINERIREELRSGDTPQAAIHAGYERAWATILDSNITTLIAGLALSDLRLRPGARLRGGALPRHH